MWDGYKGSTSKSPAVNLKLNEKKKTFATELLLLAPRQDSPSGFTLFGRLAVQQGGDTRPLVFPIFHHRCLEDLILEKRAD